MVAKMMDSRCISGFTLDFWKFPDLDRALKTGFSNGLGHNRSKVSRELAEIESFHTTFQDLDSHLWQKIMIVTVVKSMCGID